jgi:hypothetical protein
VSWEGILRSARLTDVRGILLRVLAGTGAVALLCAGCGDGGSSSGPTIPDVSGQQAARALAGLRHGGYEHFSMVARRNSKPVGIVLATNPSAGSVTAHRTQVRLVVSAGSPGQGVRRILVPGIGQCRFSSAASNGSPCVGGVVFIPVEP